MSGDRIYAQVVNERDPRFGQVGYIGNGHHNDWEVHFEDGTSQYYTDWDLKRVDGPVQPPR